MQNATFKCFMDKFVIDYCVPCEWSRVKWCNAPNSSLAIADTQIKLEKLEMTWWKDAVSPHTFIIIYKEIWRHAHPILIHCLIPASLVDDGSNTTRIALLQRPQYLFDWVLFSHKISLFSSSSCLWSEGTPMKRSGSLCAFSMLCEPSYYRAALSILSYQSVGK